MLHASSRVRRPALPVSAPKPLRASLWAATLVAISPALRAAAPDGYTLSWADEFNGSSLDTTKWANRYPGVRNDATNTADAVTVSGGALKITTYTEGGLNYTGMIGTQGKFSQAYGYWEASINFNGSPGMWSAFWLQSPTMGNPIGNPAVAGTEMDIVEFLSHPNSAGHVNMATHWDGYGADHKATSLKSNKGAALTGYHTYGLLWTPTSTLYFVDGTQVWDGGGAPVSQVAEYIILSSEVKNNNWAGVIPTGGYGNIASSTTTMQVDYVRVYTAVPEPTTYGAALAASGALGLALRTARRRRSKNRAGGAPAKISP